MAEPNLSGQYDFNLTLNSIILEALEILQAVGTGETIDGNNYNTAVRSLNMLLKLWEAQGIHLWTYEEFTLFLKVGQRIYDIRDPSTVVVDGERWKSVQLTADAAAAADSITVADASELELGNAIGILKDDNDLFWTVVERIVGNVVQLRTPLDGAASSGRFARYYATRGQGGTTLAAGAVATDQIVTVASIVGLEPGQQFGVTDDTGDVFWTTINSIDADTDQVTLNDQLTATSSIGNAVIFYTSAQNYTPFSRIPDKDAVRRHSGETSDYEIPIVHQSREEYMQLPNKQQRGTVIQTYYDRQEPAGKWYVWNAPATAVEYINFTAEREIQIMTDPQQTFDLPQEWYLAVSYNLAKLLIPKIGCSAERRLLIMGDGTPNNEGLAGEYLNQALAFDTAIYGIRLVPQQYG